LAATSDYLNNILKTNREKNITFFPTPATEIASKEPRPTLWIFPLSVPPRQNSFQPLPSENIFFGKTSFLKLTILPPS
jgi:hypothetical protein